MKKLDKEEFLNSSLDKYKNKKLKNKTVATMMAENFFQVLDNKNLSSRRIEWIKLKQFARKVGFKLTFGKIRVMLRSWYCSDRTTAAKRLLRKAA